MENSSNFQKETLIRYCEVISVDDIYGGGRIKVRIENLDDVKNYPNTDSLPYCFPLLPKMLHVMPKIGEMVFVFFQILGSEITDRFYIGPVISQDYYLYNELFKTTAKNMLNGNHDYQSLPDPKEDNGNYGNILNNNDISLRGRYDNDIIMRDSETQLRCGTKLRSRFGCNSSSSREDVGNPGETLYFNGIDMAYIQMKYNHEGYEHDTGIVNQLSGFNGDKESNFTENFNSAINIVADKINLLSYDSRQQFNLIDKENNNYYDVNNLITDDELMKILDDAHQLPYGDLLISFLKRFIDVFRRHTHPHIMLPPTLNSADEEILNTDLTKFLSNDIRIN